MSPYKKSFGFGIYCKEESCHLSNLGDLNFVIDMYFNRVTTRIVNLDLKLSLIFYNILIFANLIYNIVNNKTIRIFNKL